MARVVTLSGQTYTIPEPGDVGWGSLTDLLERLTVDVSSLLTSSLTTPNPLRRRLREVTASPTNLLSTDDVVLVNIASLSSINLPDGSTIDTGKVITIKDASGAAGTNVISIFPFGGATIDGGGQYDINENYGDVTFVFDGTNWARIQSLEDEYENGILPVGSIIPFTSHLTGSWTPPASGVVKRGLMLCDGSAIPAGQTLSGTLPDLTDNRFLMGATTSGGNGNSTDLSHNHNYVHTHSGTTATQTVAFTGTLNTSGGAASFDKTVMNTNQTPHHHEYGANYYFHFGDTGTYTGDKLIALRDYPTSSWNVGTRIRTFSRGVNNNSSLTTKAGNCEEIEVYADTEQVSVAWTTATVNTSFTNPTLSAADIQSAQTAHDHTFTTSSQSSSVTDTALAAVDVRPKYFEVLYLMRVS